MTRSIERKFGGQSGPPSATILDTDWPLRPKGNRLKLQKQYCLIAKPVCATAAEHGNLMSLSQRASAKVSTSRGTLRLFPASLSDQFVLNIEISGASLARHTARLHSPNHLPPAPTSPAQYYGNYCGTPLTDNVPCSSPSALCSDNAFPTPPHTLLITLVYKPYYYPHTPSATYSTTYFLRKYPCSLYLNPQY